MSLRKSSLSNEGSLVKSPFDGFDRYVRISILLALIIQSIGIRFFSGQGIVLSFVILIGSANALVRFTEKDFLYLLAPIVFFCFNKLINPQFDTSALIFQSVLVICAYIVLKNYKDANLLQDDFYTALKLIAYHAVIGFVLLKLAPDSFGTVSFSGMSYGTFHNLFFVNFDSIDGSGFRNCGLCWEPGLLQLVLNLLLFLSIQRKAGYLQQLIIVLAIISTFSTAGFIILGLNFFYFIIQNRNSKSGLLTITISLFLLFSFSALFLNNIMDKLGETNTSGLIRARDFKVGIELIKEKPITGHGKFSNSYLMAQRFISAIEEKIFTKEFLDFNGEMSGGFTNGLLGLFAWFGIPFGLFALVCLFKNNLIKGIFFERLIFMLIFMLTLISEPITDTSLFFFLSFSAIAFPRKAQEKKTSIKTPGNQLQLEMN